MDSVSGLGRVTPVQPTKDFIMSVMMGEVSGHTAIDKFGFNPTVTTSTDPEDIWEGGGDYPYSTSADIVSLSSSNDTDKQLIQVVGLCADGVEHVQTVRLDGQTRVAIPTPLWRVYDMSNEDDNSISGTVYCYSGTTNSLGVPSGGSVTKAIIDDGNNQSQMGLFTVPKNKVGFLYRGEVGIQYDGTAPGSAEFARMCYRSRRYGKIFKVKKTVSLNTGGSSVFQDKRSFPDVIPGMTDIKITAHSVSADMGLWAALDIMLIDKNRFSQEYLAAIGQPE